MAMSIGDRIRSAMVRSALGVTAGLFFLIGAGFLTAAAWLTLKIVAGAAVASLIVGLAFVGISGIMIAIAGRSPAPKDHNAAAKPGASPTAAAGVQEILAAFAQGLGAGLASRKKNDQ